MAWGGSTCIDMFSTFGRKYGGVAIKVILGDVLSKSSKRRAPRNRIWVCHDMLSNVTENDAMLNPLHAIRPLSYLHSGT